MVNSKFKIQDSKFKLLYTFRRFAVDGILRLQLSFDNVRTVTAVVGARLSIFGLECASIIGP